MKYQASFSLKDKSKKIKSVVSCNFAWRFNGKFGHNLVFSGTCQPMILVT